LKPTLCNSCSKSYVCMPSAIKDDDHASCTIELSYMRGELLLLVLVVGIRISCSELLFLILVFR
jgi:hypothetical protein